MTIETNQARDIASGVAIMDPYITQDRHQDVGGYITVVVCFFCGTDQSPQADERGDHDEDSCVWLKAHDLCFPDEKPEPSHGVPPGEVEKMVAP